METVVFGNEGFANTSGACWDAMEVNGSTNSNDIRKVIPFSSTTKKEFVEKNKICKATKIKNGAWKGYYSGIINN